MQADRREILAFEPTGIADDPDGTLRRIFTTSPTEDDLIYACSSHILGYIPPESLRDRAQRFPLRPNVWSLGAPEYFSEYDLAEFYSGIFTKYYRETGEVTPAAKELVLGLAEEYAQSPVANRSNRPTVADLVNATQNPRALRYSVEGYPREEQRANAVALARLAGLIKNPNFIAEPVALETLERLADIKDREPWSFGMYSYYAGERYHLEPEVGRRHIQPFGQMIGSDRLWTGQSRELRRVFFASVAQALGFLADEYPEETFNPRVELLRRNQAVKALHPNDYPHAEIEYHLVYTFNTSEERERLAALEAQTEDQEFLEVLRRMRTNDYVNTAWAI